MKNIIHLLTLLFIVITVGCFLIRSEALNQKEIWFSNVDQDSILLVDALRVNAGHEPTFVSHPALGNYILYGASLKILKMLGTIRFANINELFFTHDPILYLPGIYYGARHVSQALVLLTALALGISIFLLGGSFFLASIAGALVLNSYGLLLQSLIVRTELASMFFVSLAMLCLCALVRTKYFSRASILCFVAGLTIGMGILSKITVIPLLGVGLLVAAVISMQRRTLLEIDARATHSKAALIIAGIMLFLSCYFFGALGFDIIGATMAPTLIIALTILCLLNLVISRIRPKACVFLQFTTALMTGFLLAIPVVFYLCNLKSTAITRGVIGYVFSLDLFTRHSVGYQHGIVYLLGYFTTFLDYSFFRSGLLLAIPFGLLIADQKGRLGAMLLTYCGLGMSLLMSARYFGYHYVIYPDFFYSAALAVCLIYRNQNLLFFRYLAGKRSIMAGAALAGLVILFGIMQYAYAQTAYPEYNLGYRNQLKFVPTGFGSPEFEKAMLDRYGCVNNVMWRVIRDDKLNGSERGIKIRDLANVIDSLKCMGTLSDPGAQ